MGLVASDGGFDRFDSASLSFLFRAWVWPEASSFLVFFCLGAATTFGGWAISQAYRIGEPSYVAPVEYVSLPFSVVAGLLVFNE